MVAAPRVGTVVHSVGAWESLTPSLSVQRCAGPCGCALAFRFTDTKVPIWPVAGDRLAVHGNGLRERTDAPVSCQKPNEAAA